MKFSSTTNTTVQQLPESPISQSIPSNSVASSFKEYLNPKVRINKIANEYSVIYHPSPSRLTSRVHLLMFF